MAPCGKNNIRIGFGNSVQFLLVSYVTNDNLNGSVVIFWNHDINISQVILKISPFFQ